MTMNEMDPKTWTPAVRHQRHIALGWLLTGDYPSDLRKHLLDHFLFWEARPLYIEWGMWHELLAFNDPWPATIKPEINRAKATAPVYIPKPKRGSAPKPVKPKVAPGTHLYGEDS